ncbi:MAG: hypothetical protein Q9192_005383 [Flavoplaca navasiana]
MTEAIKSSAAMNLQPQKKSSVKPDFLTDKDFDQNSEDKIIRLTSVTMNTLVFKLHLYSEETDDSENERNMIKKTSDLLLSLRQILTEKVNKALKAADNITVNELNCESKGILSSMTLTQQAEVCEIIRKGFQILYSESDPLNIELQMSVSRLSLLQTQHVLREKMLKNLKSIKVSKHQEFYDLQNKMNYISVQPSSYKQVCAAINIDFQIRTYMTSLMNMMLLSDKQSSSDEDTSMHLTVTVVFTVESAA